MEPGGHWHSSLAPRHWDSRDHPQGGSGTPGTIPRKATAPGRRGRGPAPGSRCVCRIGVPGTGCDSPAQPRACLHRKCLITAPFISSAAVGKGDAVPVAFSARQQLGTLRWPHPSLIPRFFGFFFPWGSPTESSARLRKGGWLAARSWHAEAMTLAR